MKIIFATSNQGKLKEIREILGGLNCQIVSMKEAGIDIDIIEDGDTFEANALIKANTIMELTGDIVLADDSGLEVDYLNKEPGIYSARYLGEGVSQKDKNCYILNKLEGISKEQRTARFVCAVACALPNKENIVVKETMEGYINTTEVGANGFGYDPIFCPKEYNMTVAELNAEQKNEISHRGKALRAMKNKLIENGVL